MFLLVIFNQCYNYYDIGILYNSILHYNILKSILGGSQKGPEICILINLSFKQNVPKKVAFVPFDVDIVDKR